MRFLPIVLLSAVLLGVVVLMAGDREKGLQALRNIAIVVVGMLVMAALFAIVTKRQL
ncbi:MAG TPA: hypothetical protein VJ927_08135 [Actinomycetota bacterium]|nr:hypothetical protein [Actinomycetota bacterium]